LSGSFCGPPFYEKINLVWLIELVKVPFSKDRLISFVNEEIIEGRMNITTILGI